MLNHSTKIHFCVMLGSKLYEAFYLFVELYDFNLIIRSKTMSLHLLQTKLKYGLMSKKDMEKLQEEYNSYSDSERYMIRSLLASRTAKIEANNAQLANWENKKEVKVGDKFKFSFNKLDAGLCLGAVATCALTWGAYALGATAFVPAFAGATVALAAVGIANEVRCFLKARKGNYDLSKVVKFYKHPIRVLRTKLWARKTAKTQKIMDIINNAKAQPQCEKCQEKAAEVVAPVVEQQEKVQPVAEAACM